MHKYKLISKKGEGTFSEVVKAQVIKSGKLVAIKRMKNHFESIEQVNTLREIQALKRLSPHPYIIKMVEVLFDKPTGRLALVFELMDMNIYELIRGRKTYLPEAKVKNFMWMLLKSMHHMHRNGIFHRDIKPENLLLQDSTLKLADFGSCRGIKSKPPFTEYISTRWYRAPECLLTDGWYTYKMDMWGVGCVMFEVISLFPLFPGANELDQIQKIHNIIGTPHPDILEKMRKRSSHMNFNFPPKVGTGIDKLLPDVNPDAIDLIKKLLAYNPDERYSARQALKHPYFKELRDQERLSHVIASGQVPVPNAVSTSKDQDDSFEADGKRDKSTTDATATRSVSDFNPTIFQKPQDKKPAAAAAVGEKPGFIKTVQAQAALAGGKDDKANTLPPIGKQAPKPLAKAGGTIPGAGTTASVALKMGFQHVDSATEHIPQLRKQSR